MDLAIVGTGYPNISRLILNSHLYDEANPHITGFLDDNPANHARNLYGHTIIGGLDLVKSRDFHCVCSIARSTKLRQEIVLKLSSLGAKFVSIVHRSVDISNVEIGTGVVIGQNTVIEPGASIGDHCFIMNNTVVSHDTKVGPFTIISNGVNIQGLCDIGSLVYISPGVATYPEIHIGDRSILQTNSVASNNLSPDSILINPKSQLLRGN